MRILGKPVRPFQSVQQLLAKLQDPMGDRPATAFDTGGGGRARTNQIGIARSTWRPISEIKHHPIPIVTVLRHMAIQLRLAVRLAVQLRQLRDAWRPSKSECHGSGMVRRLRKLANISGIAASLPLGVSVARQSVLPFGSPNKDTQIEVQYEVNRQEP